MIGYRTAVSVVAEQHCFLAAACRRLCCYLRRSMSSYQPPKKLKVEPVEADDGAYTGPSEAFIEVIQNGARGMGKAVYVFTSTQCYLFNCPENTERLVVEHQMKLNRLRDIFVTYASWRNVGGMNGMVMSLRATNVPSVNVHGAQGVVPAIKAAQRYQEMNGSSLQLVSKDCTDAAYEDRTFRVEYVTLNRRRADDETERPAESSAVADVSQDVAHAYVLQLKPKPRNVLLQKCMQLRVPVGPCLRRLQLGQTVTLDDGRVVTPEDVLAPELPSPYFAVVDCPHDDFLADLVGCDAFEKFFSSPDLKLGVVIHFTAASVFQTADYQRWMRRFSDDTKHLVLNSADCVMAPHSEAVFRLNSHLNFLQPQVFPLLHFHVRNTPPSTAPQVEQQSITPQPQWGNALLAKPWLKYSLRPDFGKVSDSQPFVPVLNTYLDPLKADAEKMDALQRLRQRPPLDDHAHGTGRYPEITFFGTASASPLKARNLSGLIMQLDESTCLLCDCGEGTFYQMVSFYGFEKCQQMLLKVKAIFVSHLHADHTFGLPGLLVRRHEAFVAAKLPYEPPYLIAAPKLYQIFGLFHKCIGSVEKWCLPVWPKDTASEGSNAFTKALKAALKLRDVQFVKVNHPMYAHSLVLVTTTDKKIVYSGDTRPCEELVAAGAGADLLIHEATMEDDLREEALHKRHSTVSEALDVGARMKARFVLLTHFSGRYAKLPVIEVERCNVPFSVAFDFMRFRLNDVHSLSSIVPMLKVLYREDYDDMLMRTEKRMLRRELERNEMKAKN